MVETENLRTASAYINNQLLARGLLRDGQTIDFAGHGKSHDGSVTAARIISVVNDLILRRDRDDQNRESLSTAMRSLRSENMRYVNDVSKLEEKNADVQRKLEITAAADYAARSQLKAAESSVRALKEQLSRTKALVAQARTSCATEVRRRDRQIDTLKKQLSEAGRARGARPNPAITTIVVTGDADQEPPPPPSPTKTCTIGLDEYSLRGESTVSLAKLSQNLSEENELVMALTSQTIDQLREMSGWEQDGCQDTQQTNRQKSMEEMSLELNSVMQHMRHILNNPSFVPIEEVEVRQEEINRLKEGWVKMETRWKDAMLLIDGWRKRMAAGGSPIREDELKLGFRLGSVRLTDGMTGSTGHSTLAPLLEEPLEEEQPEEHVYEESDDDDDDADNYDCEGARNTRGEDAYVGETADYDAPAYEAAQTPLYEMEQSDEMVFKEEPGEQAEADVATEDDASWRESPPLPEAPQLSPLRHSSSAGNRRAEHMSAGGGASLAKQHGGHASHLGAAPPTRQGQGQGLEANSIHVAKRGLEQASRRPSAAAAKAMGLGLGLGSSRLGEPKSRPVTREVVGNRVTSLEEALLSKTARERLLQQSESNQAAGGGEEEEEESGLLLHKEAETRDVVGGEEEKEKKPQQQQRTRREVRTESKIGRNFAATKTTKTTRMKTTTTTTRTAKSGTPRPARCEPLPRPVEPMAQQSPLTMSNIAAKLEASAANASRVRDKVRAAKARSSSGGGHGGVVGVEGGGGGGEGNGDPVKVDPVKMGKTDGDGGGGGEGGDGKGGGGGGDGGDGGDGGGDGKGSGDDQVVKTTKRKRDIRISSKKTLRRRSTLSPMELETLISGTGM